MEIRNFDAYSPLHKSGHTSKGDQLKWKIDDRWYKADYMGYEGLSEVLVSDLLQKSTCPFPFVEYEAAVIEYNGKIFQGCSSLDFLKADQILIPLEKLYRRYTGESLAVKLSDFADVSERIQYLVTQVEEITKIDNFGAYLTAMLEIDAFFMNEDRHTNNIAVQYNAADDTYALCPLFDNGLSLLADTNVVFPLERSLEDCLKAVQVPSNRSDARFLLSPVTHSKRCTHLYSEALILSSLLAYRCDLRRFLWLFLSHDRIFLDKFCPILYTLECRG